MVATVPAKRGRPRRDENVVWIILHDETIRDEDGPDEVRLQFKILHSILTTVCVSFLSLSQKQRRARRQPLPLLPHEQLQVSLLRDENRITFAAHDRARVFEFARTLADKNPPEFIRRRRVEALRGGGERAFPKRRVSRRVNRVGEEVRVQLERNGGCARENKVNALSVLCVY